MVGRKCKVCQHEQRAEIDKAIIEDISYRAISSQFGISRQSIQRHVANGHVLKELVKADEAKVTRQANQAVDDLQFIEGVLHEIIDAPSMQHNVKIQAIGKLQDQIKLKIILRQSQQQSLVEVDFDALISGIKKWLKGKHPRVYRELMRYLHDEYERGLKEITHSR